MARRFKIGMNVRVASMSRIDAVGTIVEAKDTLSPPAYLVRLPNWQADGVHLDVWCRTYELETGHGRATVCRCPYCPGYGKRKDRHA